VEDRVDRVRERVDGRGVRDAHRHEVQQRRAQDAAFVVRRVPRALSRAAGARSPKSKNIDRNVRNETANA
jgi:hypothetical protein